MSRRLREAVGTELRQLLDDPDPFSKLSLLFFVDHSPQNQSRIERRFRARNFIALWCMRGNVSMVSDELGEYIGLDTIDVILHQKPTDALWHIHLFKCAHFGDASYVLLSSIRTKPFSLMWFQGRQEIA